MADGIFCPRCRETKARGDFNPNRKKKNGVNTFCKKCRNAMYPTKARYRARPHLAMWYLARRRADELGLPFDIEPADIAIPPRCPVLGIPLTLGSGSCHDGSPTLDRLRPLRGYVRGNIAVISSRANRIKNNATAEEIEAVANWMRGAAP